MESTRALVMTAVVVAIALSHGTLPRVTAQEDFCQAVQARSPAPLRLGVNLIVNGDGEAGPGAQSDSETVPPPGWDSTGNLTVVAWGAAGGLPTLTDPGPPDRGVNLFAGGPSSALSVARQVMEVSDLADVVASGHGSYTLAGYLGGWSSQEDYAEVTVTFLDGRGTSVGTTALGRVTAADRSGASALLLRQTSGAVPVGTIQIAVELKLTRDSGSYNDGYADNLSLIVACTPAS